MDFDQRPRPQMYDVSDFGLKCAECGADIKELPFKPSLKEDGTYGKIYCRDCNRKRRNNFRGGFRGGRY
jgi:DNA-directed RNA polymerase subunit RPC12/RpoP